MSEKKKEMSQMNLESLSGDELREVKGGIPYEKPDLIDLSDPDVQCKIGVVCTSGDGIGLNSKCDIGNACSIGSWVPLEN